MKKLLQWILIAVLFFAIAISNCDASAQDDLLHVYFIDVGQADAAIITCENKVLMIDGGNVADSSLIYSMLRNTLGIDHINYIIATHPHEDHVGGLAGALNACTVDVLYTPILNYETKAFQSMIKYAREQKTTILIPQPGDCFFVGNTCVELLAPLKDYQNCNDMSIVVKITYRDTKFLFTGDIGWEAEHDLVESGFDLSADVLKVPHHGSDTSSSHKFLLAVMPSYAVISVGEGNPYDHPTEEALHRLEDVGATVLRTDELGAIHCSSDGNDLTFDLEK